MIECPQCGTTNEDDVKNCKGCRINMYWAFQHYEELVVIRQANQLASRPETASFLIETSKRIDEEPSWAIPYSAQVHAAPYRTATTGVPSGSTIPVRAICQSTVSQ